jgi:hypothetical protein
VGTADKNVEESAKPYVGNDGSRFQGFGFSACDNLGCLVQYGRFFESLDSTAANIRKTPVRNRYNGINPYLRMGEVAENSVMQHYQVRRLRVLAMGCMEASRLSTSAVVVSQSTLGSNLKY